MILVDANLLIYAVNAHTPGHEKARDWWQETLSSNLSVALPWIVVLAFLRVVTNRRVFERPLAVEVATAYVDQWLAQPWVELVGPGRQHWGIFSRLIVQTGTAGNLVSDAHIAALALETGRAVYSADNDFKRFPGIKHVNPLAENARPQ